MAAATMSKTLNIIWLFITEIYIQGRYFSTWEEYSDVPVGPIKAGDRRRGRENQIRRSGRIDAPQPQPPWTRPPKAFCREFESKLDRADECCLPGEGSTSLPRCLGAHVRAASDCTVGSLFAVYWGAKTGHLSPDDVVGAARQLHGYDTLDCSGLKLGDPGSSGGSCITRNMGLEFYAGAVHSSCVMIDGAMSTLSDVSRRIDGWTECVTPADEVFYSQLDGGPETYRFVSASVGNFVEYRASRVERQPVAVRVCGDFSNLKEKRHWLEYVDRTGRLYRFKFACGKLLGGETTGSSLGFVIIMDALYRGYRRTDEEIQFNMKSRDATRNAVHVWECVSKAAAGVSRKQLVVAVMPALSDLDAVEQANVALVGACAMHLACRGGSRGRRVQGKEMEDLYALTQKSDTVAARA